MASRLTLLRKLLEAEEKPPDQLDRELHVDTSETVEARETRREVWSELAKQILRCYETNSFLGAIVYGRLGAGKSVYAIKVSRLVLSAAGVDVDFDIYLQSFFAFRLSKLLRIVREAKQNQRIPCLVWDDAGVAGGAYTFYTDIHSAKALSDIFRVIRTRVASVIMTTPRPQDILKPIRSQEMLAVRIYQVGEKTSEAHGYTFTLLPSGDTRFRKLFVDRFSFWLPDEEYSLYAKYRDSYVDYTLDEMYKLLALREAKLRIEATRLREKLQRLAEEGKLDPYTAYRLAEEVVA